MLGDADFFLFSRTSIVELIPEYYIRDIGRDIRFCLLLNCKIVIIIRFQRLLVPIGSNYLKVLKHERYY